MVSPGATTRLRIEFAQATDPGRDPNKQVNEDSCGYAETKFGHLCVLCDGMGGHYGGKEASRTAITTIFQIVEQTPPSAPASQALKAAIEEAARRVYRLGGPQENRARPGSTVVAMLLHERGIEVAHVGDSRAYIIRANQIYPLTRDHSMVQGMIDAGMITEAQAIGHPDANKITRALGMKPEVEVEVRPETMELFDGDVVLQSSDGLTDLALSADILGAARQALSSGDLQHACNMLVQMANDRGGHDNITVQMARIVSAGSKTGTTIPEMAAPAYAGAAVSVRGGAVPQAPPSGGGVGPTPPMTPPMGPAPGHAYTPAPWGGVNPTAPDFTPGVGPTMPGGPAPAAPNPTWGGGEPPPSLHPFRLDAQLPLPPPAGHPMHTPAPVGGYGPMTPMPPSFSYPNASPARGGIVFVIIGLSAVIAILLILCIWALFLRG